MTRPIRPPTTTARLGRHGGRALPPRLDAVALSYTKTNSVDPQLPRPAARLALIDVVRAAIDAIDVAPNAAVKSLAVAGAFEDAIAVAAVEGHIPLEVAQRALASFSMRRAWAAATHGCVVTARAARQQANMLEHLEASSRCGSLETLADMAAQVAAGRCRGRHGEAVGAQLAIVADEYGIPALTLAEVFLDHIPNDGARPAMDLLCELEALERTARAA